MSNRTKDVDNLSPQAVVYVVDDDELVTTTLSSYLEMETDYEVHAFHSGIEALNELKKNPPDVVVSDFLMPKMDGLQFLSEVKNMYPDCTRILLTGYADKENAIKAINEVGLYQYIEKPWDNEHLKLLIRNGVSHKQLRCVLEEKIRELDDVLLEKDALAQRNDMLKQELLLAQSVQQSMLPQAFPSSDGFSIVAKYQPALEIGGDFYDVINLADDRLAILIADVTGHGIQAALMTVLLKSAFATFRDQNPRPQDILKYMNQVLCKVLPKGHFVAAMIAIVDLRNSTCTLVNAGVPHPYHLKSRDKTTDRIPANGLLLGIADDKLFNPGEEVSVQLQKGDRLILFTDGITEAENESQEHFENTVLFQTLKKISHKSNHEILEELTQAARNFSTAEHKWDDVTIIGIESN
ncbi:fused response regulator/phosphatase [candidate division KSB1 bacterium]|nr:fused response regulator/phosphatase [candidate division KSB1 bacterium]NIR72400.1 fused response regulator/phosphatase [candidate division KSB1 bacterium]NIS25065.1 fused response regulator/phosphatase [candidate division KSB1 bacterium]NIT71984.1 fused response regulator/phosphatase [candidate division KSB1 bacterium]NIU25742.1 fused response regulator/phosphatase [candidate division KSB1 bacterium]